MTRRRLPVLDPLRVGGDCDAAWDAMPGSDRSRHCARCDHAIYDLSALTRGEAEALVSAHAAVGKRLCGAITHTEGGTMANVSWWSRLRAAREQGVLVVAAAAVLVGATALGYRGPLVGALLDAEARRVAATAAIASDGDKSDSSKAEPDRQTPPNKDQQGKGKKKPKDKRKIGKVSPDFKLGIVE